MLAEARRLADLHKQQRKAFQISGLQGKVRLFRLGGVDPEAHTQDWRSWKMMPSGDVFSLAVFVTNWVGNCANTGFNGMLSTDAALPEVHGQACTSARVGMLEGFGDVYTLG
mmetsp:Transcript_17058/g.17295  ORF Transcript_17058/g.17295 Transcript_17058/m.17295 type:complete len:112 (-) Transcript_17058:59-394(-)